MIGLAHTSEQGLYDWSCTQKVSRGCMIGLAHTSEQGLCDWSSTHK